MLAPEPRVDAAVSYQTELKSFLFLGLSLQQQQNIIILSHK